MTSLPLRSATWVSRRHRDPSSAAADWVRKGFYLLSSLGVGWLQGDPGIISSPTSFTSCRRLKGMLFCPQKIPLIIFLCLRAQYAETGRVHTHTLHLYARKHTHTFRRCQPAALLSLYPEGEKIGGVGGRGFSIITC